MGLQAPTSGLTSDDLAVITMEQTQPFNKRLIHRLKGPIYDAEALKDRTGITEISRQYRCQPEAFGS